MNQTMSAPYRVSARQVPVPDDKLPTGRVRAPKEGIGMALMAMDEDLLAKVMDGRKTSTIRLDNKWEVDEGHSIMLVSDSQKAIVRVKRMRRVALTKDHRGLVRISLDGEVLPTLSARRFAIAEGFASITDMIAWFNARPGYSIPFTGIHFEFDKEVRECK